MRRISQYFRENPLSFLLVAIPFAVAASLVGWSETVVFILAAIGIIPLAGVIGNATERLAAVIGPRWGGLLNATLGNAAELIITLVAIRAGLLDVVKASITGSIIGNLLLVMGIAMIVGGARHGLQTFNRRQSSNNAILLGISLTALVVPSLFSHTIGPDNSVEVEALSLGVAIIMILLYAAGLVYSFTTPHSPITHPASDLDPSDGDVLTRQKPTRTSAAHPAKQRSHPGHEEAGGAHWSLRTTLIVLAVATAGVVWMSELLVGAVEPAMQSLGLSEFFLGIILIPIIGNAAEHLVAVQVAAKNQMELSVEIALSSSLQIALFVAPLLVFVSLLLGHPLTLIFNQFELLALGASVAIVILVAGDGESNWLEGCTLVGVYTILGLAFFFL